MEHGPAVGHRRVSDRHPIAYRGVAARGVTCLAGNINGVWRRPGSQSESKRRSAAWVGTFGHGPRKSELAS